MMERFWKCFKMDATDACKSSVLFLQKRMQAFFAHWRSHKNLYLSQG